MSSQPDNQKIEPADNRWSILFARKLELETIQAFRFFRDHDVEPLLIKGWAAARNYPSDRPRFYSDVDIAVSRSDFDRSKKLLLSPEGSKIAVDLHLELRHLDTKPWQEIVSDSVEVELDGYQIRIPRPEDHLRILAVHWLNDGGESKDRLYDIFYAVRNRPNDFDWDKCLGQVSENRRGWVLAVLGLTHKYYDLEIRDLPFSARDLSLPRWLVSAVEKEWEAAIPHRSLHTCLNDPKEFLRQLRKRFPPNPLQATIEQEGNLDDGSRLRYQLGSLRDRVFPSLRGVAQTAFLKFR